MRTLWIANDFSPDVRGDRGWTSWWVQRVAWFLRDNDGVILGAEPDWHFAAYVGNLLNIDVRSIEFVFPENPIGSLTRDLVRLALERGPWDEIRVLWPDSEIAVLLREEGAADLLEGAPFFEQGGGVLLNSKSAFRAIAGGSGVPIPNGGVAHSIGALIRLVSSCLDESECVAVKHDFMSGGHGNEILTRGEQFQPVGARRVTRIDSEADLVSWAERSWQWFSTNNSRPVVEEYIRHSPAYFAEFSVSAESVQLEATGELLSAPYAVGEVMPAQGLERAQSDALVGGGRRLAEAVQRIGYRGLISADAIVSPEGQVYFTEFNGRVTGSTHIYGGVGGRVLQEKFGSGRVILERVWPEAWHTDSFEDALRRLERSGLAYDRATSSGIVVTTPFDGRGGVMYAICAADLSACWALDRSLEGVWGSGDLP